MTNSIVITGRTAVTENADRTELSGIADDGYSRHRNFCGLLLNIQ